MSQDLRRTLLTQQTPTPNAGMGVSTRNLLELIDDDHQAEELQGLKKRFAALQLNLKKSATFGKKLVMENSELKVRIEDSERELADLTERRALSKKKYDRLEGESRVFKSAHAARLAEHDALRDSMGELGALRAEHAHVLRANTQLRQELTETRSKVRNLREDTTSLSERVADLTRFQHDSQATKEKNASLREEITKINEEVDFQSRGVDALQNEKKQLSARIQKKSRQMKQNFANQLGTFQNNLIMNLGDMRTTLSTLRRHFQYQVLVIEGQMAEEVSDLIVQVDATEKEAALEVHTMKRVLTELQDSHDAIVHTTAPSSLLRRPLEEVVLSEGEGEWDSEEEEESDYESEEEEEGEGEIVYVYVQAPRKPRPTVEPIPKPELTPEPIADPDEATSTPTDEPEPEPEPEPRVPRPEEPRLLRWIRHYLRTSIRDGHIPRHDLPSSFDTPEEISRFRDGLLICGLLHRTSKDVLDWESAVEPGNDSANRSLALELARDNFGVRDESVQELLDLEVEDWNPDTLVDFLLDLYTSLKKRHDVARSDYQTKLKSWSDRLNIALMKRARNQADLQWLDSELSEGTKALIRLNVFYAQLRLFYSGSSARNLQRFYMKFNFARKLTDLGAKIMEERIKVETRESLGPDVSSIEERESVISSFNELCVTYMQWVKKTEKMILEEQNASEIVQEGDQRVLDDFEDDEDRIDRKKKILEENRGYLKEIWRHYNLISFSSVKEVESVMYSKEQLEAENHLLGFVLHGVVSKRISKMMEIEDPE